MLMSIYEAVNVMRRALNDSAYEFGSTSYQDRCEGISVSSRRDTLVVVIKMYVADNYYRKEVQDNIEGILNSIRYQYDIPYGIDYEIRFC